MSYISEKVAYLDGLADGLECGPHDRLAVPSPLKRWMRDDVLQESVTPAAPKQIRRRDQHAARHPQPCPRTQPKPVVPLSGR